MEVGDKDARDMDASVNPDADLKQNYSEDPLYLQSCNHPGTILVTSPLTGNNYLTWSRSMRIALGAKVKLRFINGKSNVANDSPNYEQWKRVDCMVTSWILNSISKEIVDAFLYMSTVQELWKELEERFGESNEPLLYQIQREIN